MWNSMIRAWLAAAILTAAAGLQPANGQEADGGERSIESVAGDWALNRALSDDPADQLRSVRGAAPPPAGMERGGRPAPDRSGFEAVRRAAERFGIEQTDSTVVVAYPDRELVLFTDGRKQRVDVGEDREVEFHSWWDGGRLFIERKLEGVSMYSHRCEATVSRGRSPSCECTSRLPTIWRTERRLGRLGQPGDSASAGWILLTRRAGM
jgi:hypothetical protein